MKGKKLFLFLIGGTGVRVLKSLLFLLASGVKVDASEIIPIYIDADKSNGNWKEVEDILKWYRKLYDEGNFESEGNFFSTKISKLNEIQAKEEPGSTKNDFQITLEGTEDMSFRDYIGYSSLDSVNKDFISMLYSEEELDINMTYGFFGNPNIGSVVFQGLESSEEFSIMKNKFSQGDRFFFVSSIFGGTGAAGYPTILQLLNSSDNNELSKSLKGALSVLPYFKLNENENSLVDHNSFLTKTQAAMQYYKKAIFKESKINAQYYIGDNQETGSYENNHGGKSQKNIAHFVEKASAMGIIHFANTPDETLKSGGVKHYEFGARRKSGEAISFAHLGDDLLDKVVKPLSKFFLSIIYLNNNLPKKLEKLTWARNPSMGGSLDSNFFNSSEFYNTNFKSFSYEFLNWIGHLHMNKVAFKPFKLGTGISGDVPYNKILDNIKNLLNSGADILDTIEKVNKKKTGFFNNNFINGEDTFSEHLNKLVIEWVKKPTSPKKTSQKFLLLFSLASQEVLNVGTERIVNLSISETDTKAEFFTLSSETNGKEGWSLSSEYKDIDDPNGLSSKKKLTSIPSPLARFALQDTAFKMVMREEKKGKPDFLIAKLIGEDGKLPIYHQLVSDGLDILIILYQLKKAQNIKFVEWTTTDSLRKLLDEKSITGRKLLGKSIQLSLKELGESFHFNKMNGKFHILKYNNIPFGITSPLTLVYPSPNREQVEKAFNSGQNKLRFGDDIVFDKELCHLHKREPKSFIFYLESIMEFYKLKNICKNLSDYIERNINLLEEKNHFNYEESFNEVNINSNGIYDINSSTKVYIMENLILRTEKDGEENIKKSDFIIKATRNISGNLPLVLQNDFDDKSMIYVSTPWDKSTRVNYHDPHPINLRHLPADGSLYPYLTVDDFLESNLIKLDYKINSRFYFNGNNNNNGYLLPLKPAYFDYFTEDDITKKVNDKEMISILDDGSNRVKVFLRIPVQKNKTILFEKWYSKEVTPDRNLKEGGKLENFVFDLAISPLLRAPKLNNCRMMIFSDKDRQYKLYQYNLNNNVLQNINEYKRTSFDFDETRYFNLDQSDLSYFRFEFSGGASAILLPKYKENEYKQGNDSYMFAVDFGTTNTHIEYSVVGENNPKPFHKPDKEETMLAMLHNPKDKELKGSIAIIQQIITNEFIPFEFGSQESQFPQLEISFPQRTSLMVTPMTDSSKRDFLWDSNIPFLFGKKNISPGSEFRSNLKWGNFTSSGGDKNAIKDVEVFFDEILFMIRNRILLSNGNLKGTELLSFYPYSMPTHMRDDLRKKWNDSFGKFFPEGDDHKVKTMSESIAPFYFFKHTSKVNTSGSIIAIDIGGGTSDVAIFSEKAELPDILTSFRFASKALFGDGLSKSPLPEENGFIEAFKNEIRNLLKNDKEGLLDFMDIELERKKRSSEEWIAFFFSLDSTLERNKQRTFMQILRDEKRFMVVYLLYFSAMIYHIAKIYKNYERELPLPTHIILTGMGSRSLNPIDRDGKFGSLATFTKLIFESVLEDKKFKEGTKLEIISKKEIAKEVTCKGGILASTNTESAKDPVAVENKKVIYTIFENEASSKFLFKDHSKKNANITKDDIIIVSQEVDNFLKLFISLLEDKKKFNASNELGIEVTKSIEIIRDISDHVGSITGGLGYMKSDAEIEETLFFFPIINIIHKLAFSMVQK